MFLKRISVNFSITYALLIHTIIGSDCLEVKNEIEKINLNLNLSAAINFIVKSVSASTIRVIGCNSYFQTDFNEIAKHWRTNVSLTLLNMEKIYKSQQKILKKDFILMLVDQQYGGYLQMFLGKMMGRIRRHKMLVIFKTTGCDDNGSLNELSSFLWSNKILNFIILRDCNNVPADVYSYFPFANGKCRKFSETNIIKLGTFYYNTSDKISFHTTHSLNTTEMDTFTGNYLPFFPNKVPLQLNNCKIIVSTGIFEPSVVNVNKSNGRGIEMDFVFAIMQHMNASIKLVVDSQSWHGLTQNENEEHSGRLAILKNETFDIMAGSIPVHINIYRDFDTSECFLPNSIGFLVPTAAVFPSSMILWSMFEGMGKKSEWSDVFYERPLSNFNSLLSNINSQKQTTFLLLIVGVVLILSIIVNLLIQTTWKVRLNSKPKTSFVESILTTFLMFLRSLIETSTPRLPENRSIRWIYGMWFGASLIISCYFNTTLTSFFTEPGRLKQLETIQDIIDSNIQVAMNDIYYPIVTVDPVVEKYFVSKNTNCSVQLGLKLTAMGVAVTFTDVFRAEYIAAQWVSSSGAKSIQFIAKGSLKYWHNFIFYRGNVFTDRINNLLKRINQSGYWEHQKRKYYNRRLIRTLIRQYLIVYNYHQGISNDRLIKDYNKDFLDSNSLLREMAERKMPETNDYDIIERFVRTDKTLVTWETLSTVFRLWAIGMCTAGVVFIFERLIHSFIHYLL